MTDIALNPAMAWDRLEPPQRAGDVAQRRPLVVRPVQRRRVDELLVVDDDLPQAAGATLVWLEREPDGAWTAWAAQLRDAEATPWIVVAQTVRLVRPDPSLLRLLGPDAAAVAVEGEPRPVEPMPRQLACICREKSAESAHRAAESGWITLDAVKRRTGAVFGECQARRCEARIAAGLDLGDRRHAGPDHAPATARAGAGLRAGRLRRRLRPASSADGPCPERAASAQPQAPIASSDSPMMAIAWSTSSCVVTRGGMMRST